MAEQLAELNKGVEGKLINGSTPSTSVPSSSWHDLSTLDLKANHTYIVCGSHDYTQNVSSVVTVDQLYIQSVGVFAIARSANGMVNGGGVCLSAIIRLTADGTLKFQTYQNSGSARTAYNVTLNAYQLD